MGISNVVLRAGKAIAARVSKLKPTMTIAPSDENIGKILSKPKKFQADIKKTLKESGRKVSDSDDEFAAELLNIFFKRMPKVPLTDKELQQLRNIQGGIMSNLMTNINKYMQGKSFPALVENFAAKKDKLVKELSKTCDKPFIERIKKAKTPEQMTQLLLKGEFGFIKDLGKILSTSKKKITLEMEQIIHEQTLKRSNYIFAREKAMHVPSTKPQVIAIENMLKEKYGVKFVSLKDDEDMAKQILEAFEIANKNGVTLPKNVVVSDFMMSLGEHLQNETILLASKNSEKFSKELNEKVPKILQSTYKYLRSRLPNTNQMSTASHCHAPLHEIMHGEHLPLVSFSSKKIPQKYNDVKMNLSAYSAMSSTHETFTELNTKRLIDGLTQKEQELYDYLNFYS